MKTISRNLLLLAMAAGGALLIAAVMHSHSQQQRNQKLSANLARVSAIALGSCDPKEWELVVTEKLSDPNIITPILERMRRYGAKRVKGYFSGLQGPYLFLAANGEPVYWVWYYPEERYLRLMGAEKKGDRYKAVYVDEDRGIITVVDFPGFSEFINKAWPPPMSSTAPKSDANKMRSE